MDKHPKSDSVWYELITAPDPVTGKPARFYSIYCHRCGEKSRYHANGMSDERMRKKFIQRKWQIGKRRNLHTCQRCIAEGYRVSDVKLKLPIQPAMQEPTEQQCANADAAAIHACAFCEATSLTHELVPGRVENGNYIAHICTDCVRMIMDMLNPHKPWLTNSVQTTVERSEAAGQVEADNDDGIANWFKELQRRSTK